MLLRGQVRLPLTSHRANADPIILKYWSGFCLFLTLWV
jgi:hypothetical protein